MRVFFDTNVWIAALIARGLCADLVGVAMAAHDTHSLEVLTCPAVLAETQRLLREKFRASDAQLRAAQTMFQHISSVPDGSTAMPPGFPDADDWPIATSALAASVDLFVTGDKALLALEAIEGMPVLDPRSAYMKLRGLE